MVNRNPVARLQYYKKAGKFRWRLLAHNGRQLAECSKGHATKYAAQKNWQAVAAACAGDASEATGRHKVEDLSKDAKDRKSEKKPAVKKVVRKKAPAKKVPVSDRLKRLRKRTSDRLAKKKAA